MKLKKNTHIQFSFPTSSTSSTTSSTTFFSINKLSPSYAIHISSKRNYISPRNFVCPTVFGSKKSATTFSKFRLIIMIYCEEDPFKSSSSSKKEEEKEENVSEPHGSDTVKRKSIFLVHQSQY